VPVTPAGGFGGGLLNSLRQVLWVPINQRAFRRVSLDVFGHLLDMDLDFHLHRKTGAAATGSLGPPLPEACSIPCVIQMRILSLLRWRFFQSERHWLLAKASAECIPPGRPRLVSCAAGQILRMLDRGVSSVQVRDVWMPVLFAVRYYLMHLTLRQRFPVGN